MSLLYNFIRALEFHRSTIQGHYTNSGEILVVLFTGSSTSILHSSSFT